jgi:hypothetical protein
MSKKHIVANDDTYLLQLVHMYRHGDVVRYWESAAKEGSFEIIKWLYDNGIFYNHRFMIIMIAAEHGHLELVKWIHEHKRVCSNTPKTMDWAAYNGHLHVVVWLHEHGYRCTTDAMDWSSRDRGVS